jgi:hypothetical protein
MFLWQWQEIQAVPNRISPAVLTQHLFHRIRRRWQHPTEGDLNPAYISALSALAGAAIGGLTSFVTSWLTLRTQLRHAHREAEKAKLEALYGDFIAEATRLFGEAMTQQAGNITEMIGLYAMVGRMRLISARPVIDAAVRVEDTIIEIYHGPNRSLDEILDFAHQGGLDILTEYSEACRKDLAVHATAVR